MQVNEKAVEVVRVKREVEGTVEEVISGEKDMVGGLECRHLEEFSSNEKI